jgi:transposase
MILSPDFRQRIISTYEAGEQSIKDIAERFKVSKDTVENLLRLQRETGSLAPRKIGHPSLTIWDDTNLHQIVRDLVAEKNDATLEEYCYSLEQKTGMRISVSQMCKLLQLLKLYRKKKTLRATEGDCEEVEQARIAWEERTRGIDPDRFVFIDETGSNLGMVRRYARAEGEARAHGHAPKNPGGNVSIVGSIRLNGQITAMNFSGSLDGEAFVVYAEKILCRTLRSGDIVIMDNLSVHKNQRVCDLIEARGAEVWFLPPYSPHLNPIEECWSKVKTILRTVAARTREALDKGITQALKAIAPSDAQGWFTHSGYVIASA